MKEFKPIYINGEKTRYVINKKSEILNIETGQYLKQWIPPRDSKYKYNSVSLSHNNIAKSYLVHRLVAETFIPNPENKRTVNHKIPGYDGRRDNSVDNLEWNTDLENVNHAWENDVAHARKCEDSNFAKYTNEQIQHACSLLENGIKLSDIVDKTGVKKYTLRDILFYGRWVEIRNQYNIDESKYRSKRIFDNDTDSYIISFLKTDNNFNLKPKKICKKLGIEYSDSVRKRINALKSKIKKSSTTIENTDEDDYYRIVINV